MGTRAKRSERCLRCRMHTEDCLCALVEPIETATRIVVVMHRRERTKPTSTAHLAALALPRCEIRVRGHEDAPVQWDDVLTPDRRAILLFPTDDAAVLTRAVVDEDARPITLIVPDGSWRQAKKVPARESALAGVPAFRLPPDGPSRYRLRREPATGGLATLEAISRALGILEGPDVRARLDALFEVMVHRTLLTRGAPR